MLFGALLVLPVPVPTPPPSPLFSRSSFLFSPCVFINSYVGATASTGSSSYYSSFGQGQSGSDLGGRGSIYDIKPKGR